MGRRKIEIQPITHERNRSVTFLKRKNGLFKKAYELGVLCSVDVAVIIFEERPGHHVKLHEYCSTDVNRMVQRHLHFDGEKESKAPPDFSNKPDVPEEDDEDGDDDETGAKRRDIKSGKPIGVGVGSTVGGGVGVKPRDPTKMMPKTGGSAMGLSLEVDYSDPSRSLTLPHDSHTLQLPNTQMPYPVSGVRYSHNNLGSLGGVGVNVGGAGATGSNKRPRTDLSVGGYGYGGLDEPSSYRVSSSSGGLFTPSSTTGGGGGNPTSPTHSSFFSQMGYGGTRSSSGSAHQQKTHATSNTYGMYPPFTQSLISGGTTPPGSTSPHSHPHPHGHSHPHSHHQSHHSPHHGMNPPQHYEPMQWPVHAPQQTQQGPRSAHPSTSSVSPHPSSGGGGGGYPPRPQSTPGGGGGGGGGGTSASSGSNHDTSWLDFLSSGAASQAPPTAVSATSSSVESGAGISSGLAGLGVGLGVGVNSGRLEDSWERGQTGTTTSPGARSGSAAENGTLPPSPHPLGTNGNTTAGVKRSRSETSNNDEDNMKRSTDSLRGLPSTNGKIGGGGGGGGSDVHRDADSASEASLDERRKRWSD